MSAQTTTPQPEANLPMLGGHDAAMRHPDPGDLALAYGLLRVALGVNILLAIGALLDVGAFTRAALVAGEPVIIGLVFGTSLLPDAGTSVSLQMLYALIYAVLLGLARANAYSLDALRARQVRS